MYKPVEKFLENSQKHFKRNIAQSPIEKCTRGKYTPSTLYFLNVYKLVQFFLNYSYDFFDLTNIYRSTYCILKSLFK